jgi:hypothetical protein
VAAMTDMEKLNEVVKELGELLKAKNDRIAVQDWHIESLERKVKELEGGKVCHRRILEQG